MKGVVVILRFNTTPILPILGGLHFYLILRGQTEVVRGRINCNCKGEYRMHYWP